MRSGRLGFGLFIITVGAIWLASAYGWAPSSWAVVLAYWPVVIILWGLALMLRSGPGRGFVLSLAAVFAAVWIAVWLNPVSLADQTTGAQQLSVPAVADVTEGKLRFDSGAGTFTLTSGDELIGLQASSSYGQYHLEKTVAEGAVSARVWYETPWRRTHMTMMRRGWRNEATVALSEKLVWQIDANVGAADFTFDAARLKIEEATISAGAASLDVTLADLVPLATVTFKAGASDITVRVPEEAAVQATLSTGLTGKDLADLKSISDRVWQSSGYDTADRKIDLHFETGVSSIELIRY